MALTITDNPAQPFAPTHYFCSKLFSRVRDEFWQDKALRYGEWNTWDWALLTTCNTLLKLVPDEKFKLICGVSKQTYIDYLRGTVRTFIATARYYLALHGIYCQYSLYPELCVMMSFLGENVNISMLALPDAYQFFVKFSDKNIDNYEEAPLKYIKLAKENPNRVVLLFDAFRDINHNMGALAEYLGQNVYTEELKPRGYYTKENFKEFLEANATKLSEEVFFDLVEPVANSWVRCFT